LNLKEAQYDVTGHGENHIIFTLQKMLLGWPS